VRLSRWKLLRPGTDPSSAHPRPPPAAPPGVRARLRPAAASPPAASDPRAACGSSSRSCRDAVRRRDVEGFEREVPAARAVVVQPTQVRAISACDGSLAEGAWALPLGGRRRPRTAPAARKRQRTVSLFLYNFLAWRRGRGNEPAPDMIPVGCLTSRFPACSRVPDSRHPMAKPCRNVLTHS
jgi:hypothetical protein